MKKVVFAVTRYVRNEPQKQSGIGFITDEDLIIACVGKNNKPYIRIFEDCIKDCHPIPDKENEFRGSYYEIREI